ncbi:tumor necrosis factor receptor superfamily member 8 isoform X2 [Notamacropus eugenii]|uniref:tumor necrosis factor receptor superfamily member 8 isoform X2 n=1 Tax=Notamacropus eugenii TaxID=9315 RepID=UPI003B6720ED
MTRRSAALGLLLLGVVGALPQKQGLCGLNFYHNESSGSCCYRCPSGQVPWKPCPQGPEDCRKKCDPDYYLEEERKSRCQPCVSCIRGDLVKKNDCTWNSPRVCECQKGMFCATPVSYSCARCVEHSLCSEGTRVKHQGTPEKNTVCEPCPPGTFSNQSSNAKDCQPHTRCTTPIRQKGNATHDNVCSDLDPPAFITSLHTISPTVRIPDTTDPSNTTASPSDWSSTHDIGTLSPSLTGRPNPELHLHSGQAFQPKVMTTGYSPRKNCQQPKSLPKNAEISEKQGLMSSPPALETNNHVTSCSKEPIGLDLNVTENVGPGDIPEPRATVEHTNNQIENIYIMKAETVIVGSVTKVSEGRNPAATLALEEQAQETDQSAHYPEQETKLSPGGHVEVMFSVEEEGKEYHLPTAASAK